MYTVELAKELYDNLAGLMRNYPAVVYELVGACRNWDTNFHGQVLDTNSRKLLKEMGWIDEDGYPLHLTIVAVNTFIRGKKGIHMRLEWPYKKEPGPSGKLEKALEQLERNK